MSESLISKPQFIAHRGYAANYPENTLLAIEAAYQQGARYIEVDVLLTADNVPVLFHDRDLQRLCGVSGAIHEYTYQQLQNFTAAYTDRFGDQFTGNRITSLQQLVDFVLARPDLQMFIEIKRQSLEAHGQDKVLTVMTKVLAPIITQSTLISYDHACLQTVAAQHAFATGVVVDRWHDYQPVPSWQPQWLFCDVEGLPEDLSAFPGYPPLAVFEVSEVALAENLIQRGIHYLETFRIGEMLQAFART